MSEYKEVSTSQQEPGHKSRVTSFKATQLIWLVTGVLEGLLGLRFLFKLIAVNPGNAFASFLYAFTDFFLRPFQTLVASPSIGNSVIEFSTIIAILVYGLVGWALERLVYIMFYKPRGPVTIRQTTYAEQVPPPPSNASQGKQPPPQDDTQPGEKK